MYPYVKKRRMQKSPVGNHSYSKLSYTHMLIHEYAHIYDTLIYITQIDTFSAPSRRCVDKKNKQTKKRGDESENVNGDYIT